MMSTTAGNRGPTQNRVDTIRIGDARALELASLPIEDGGARRAICDSRSTAACRNHGSWNVAVRFDARARAHRASRGTMRRLHSAGLTSGCCGSMTCVRARPVSSSSFISSMTSRPINSNQYVKISDKDLREPMRRSLHLVLTARTRKNLVMMLRTPRGLYREDAVAPSRGRGSKPGNSLDPARPATVRPSRGAWIETPGRPGFGSVHLKVAPSRGRGSTPIPLHGASGSGRRPLAGAWIETSGRATAN